MAVTINSTPSTAIAASALYDVVTSLVEDSTHYNVRLRASLYHEGVIRAVIEKPKGLPKFDFSEILSTLIIGCLKERASGDSYECGSIGSQLLTSWASYSGTWTTLTTSGRQITSAICTVSSVLQSNAVTMAVGELYLLHVPDLVSSGTNRPRVYLSTGGAAEVELYANRSYLLMPTSTGSITLRLGNVASQNFAGTFNLYKITTDRETIGGMLAPYFVSFTEYYEDASGVTQTGATSKSKLFRFVKASAGLVFNDYVLQGSTSKFANMNFRAGAMVYYTSDPQEMRLSFFSEYVDLDLYQGINGGALSLSASPFCVEGWGVVILDSNSMSTVTSQSQFRINDGLSAAVLSETLTVLASSLCISARAILEYVGFTGGEECLSFNGEKTGSFEATRSFYKDSRQVNKLIRVTGVGRYKLQSLVSDMYLTDYLTPLLLSDTVRLMIPDVLEPIPVTIISDEAITSSEDIFVNEIEVEYDYGY